MKFLRKSCATAVIRTLCLLQTEKQLPKYYGTWKFKKTNSSSWDSAKFQRVPKFIDELLSKQTLMTAFQGTFVFACCRLASRLPSLLFLQKHDPKSWHDTCKELFKTFRRSSDGTRTYCKHLISLQVFSCFSSGNIRTSVEVSPEKLRLKADIWITTEGSGTEFPMLQLYRNFAQFFVDIFQNKKTLSSQ